MLSKQAIAEFREIYFKRYGKTLTDEEATERATGLLSLYKAVYEPSLTMKRNMNYERNQGTN